MPVTNFPPALKSFVSHLASFVAQGLDWVYEFGFLDQVHLKTPVLSVGNLTLGGTGKTPFVQFLVTELRSRNVQVAVVSLNYKANLQSISLVDPNQSHAAQIFGDEPTFLAEALKPLGVQVVVGPRKWETALWAETHLRPQVIVVDDGFQHRPLARETDFVLIDASAPMEDYQFFPRGKARDLWTSLKKADVLVLTKVNQADELWLDHLRELLPAGMVRVEMAGRLAGDFLEESQKKVLAFAGLGRPESFKKSLEEEAFFELLEFKAFPDHHKYSSQDIKALLDRKEELGADLILTTQKDWTKVKSFLSPHLDFVKPVGFELYPVEQKDDFYAFLDEKIRSWASS